MDGYRVQVVITATGSYNPGLSNKVCKLKLTPSMEM